MGKRIPSVLLLLSLTIALLLNVVPGMSPVARSAAPPPIAGQLAGIKDQLIEVFGYYAGQWQIYDPADSVSFDMPALLEGRGYWVRVSADCTLAYNSHAWNLIYSYNLIGWIETGQPASDPGSDIATQLASISSQIIIVWAYDSNEWKLYDPADPTGSNLTVMVEGNGYWVHVANACTLTYLNNSWSLTKGWNLLGWIEGGQHTITIQGSETIADVNYCIPPKDIGLYTATAYAYPEEADARFGRLNSPRTDIVVQKLDNTNITVSVKTKFCDAMKMNGGGLVNDNPQDYIHLVQWTLEENIFEEINEVVGSQGRPLAPYSAIARCPSDANLAYGDQGLLVIQRKNISYEFSVDDTCPACCRRGNGIDFWLGVGEQAYSEALKWGKKTAGVYVYFEYP